MTKAEVLLGTNCERTTGCAVCIEVGHDQNAALMIQRRDQQIDGSRSSEQFIRRNKVRQCQVQFLLTGKAALAVDPLQQGVHRCGKC